MRSSAELCRAPTPPDVGTRQLDTRTLPIRTFRASFGFMAELVGSEDRVDQTGHRLCNGQGPKGMKSGCGRQTLTGLARNGATDDTMSMRMFSIRLVTTAADSARSSQVAARQCERAHRVTRNRWPPTLHHRDGRPLASPGPMSAYKTHGPRRRRPLRT